MKSISVRDGMHIAYQEWGNGNSIKIVAAHGWLDNSNSFKILGPKLASIGYHCVAIDHIGHGKSSRLGCEAQYSLPTFVSYLNEVIEHLGWENLDIVGHSMGAMIGLIFASAFPEKVNKLVLVDGLPILTVLTADASKCAHNLRRSLESEKKYRLKASAAPGGDTSKIYPTLADAVEARIKSVASYPGTQTLSHEAALDLVSRGTYRVDAITGAPLANESDRDNVLGDGAVRFHHDPRLLLPERVNLSDDHVASFIKDLTAKTLFITAENGWPVANKAAHEAHLQRMADKGVLTHVTMPGSHHLHMDPDTEPAVSRQITDFLQQAK